MEKEEKPRLRKETIKKGQVTQKMVTFRADFDVIEVLEQQSNKGRFLNNLVKDWVAKSNKTK